MTALEYFRLLAPEFAAIPDSTVNAWLGIAGNVANVSCLDDERAAMALALYAAHSLSVSQKTNSNGSQGAVTMEKEGDLQRSYGTVQGGDTWLGGTGYGQQYLDLTSACFGASIMTRIA